MDDILKVQNISFGYQKNNLLFNNFSLTLKKGEIKALVGPSGIGKSTLFELILGNLKPQAGSIKSDICSQVFQDPYSSFHPSYPILNQIKDVCDTKGIDKLLESFSLDGSLLSKLPHELSGGQLQRASIVRAILMKPELLLLDEPTSALDNIIQLDVMKKLLNYLDDIGMLLITHDIDLARWCSDEIVDLS